MNGGRSAGSAGLGPPLLPQFPTFTTFYHTSDDEGPNYPFFNPQSAVVNA